MKIENGVAILKVKVNAFGKESTVYPTLIYDKGDTILVDTGYPGCSDIIIDAINNSETSFDKVNKIILTHQDIDHIGGLNEILNKAKHNIQTLAYKDEIKYITGERPPHKLEKLESNFENLPDQMKTLYKYFKRGFASSYATIDTPLKDHEVIDVNGGIEVVHTGGHTEGHICLYLNKYKILIAGDLLTIVDGNLTTFGSDINLDQKALKAAIQTLNNYDIEKIICYHGGVFEDSESIKSALSKL